MGLSRRDFLLTSIQLGGSLFLSTAFAGVLRAERGRRTVLVLADNDEPVQASRKKLRASPIRGAVCVVNPESGTVRRISAPLFAHGFAQSPVEPELVIGVEKWTEQAGAFHLRENRMVHLFKAPAPLSFFGHAAFDPSGQYLFISAAKGPRPDSVLAVYDRKTWKLLDCVEIGSSNPHEVSLDPTGKYFLMTNHTEVVTLSIPEAKVLKRYETGPGRHILWLDSESVVLGGRVEDPRGKVLTHLSYLNLATGAKSNFRDGRVLDEAIHGEVLSMARFDQDRVIGTVPDSKYVLLWNFRTNALITQKTENALLGVVHYQDHLFANYKKNGGKSELSLSPSGEIPAAHLDQKWGRGSHLYSFSIPT